MERAVHEEFRRRIKTQTVLPDAATAPMLFRALLAFGQIVMRKVDGWETLCQPLDPETLDLAAERQTLNRPGDRRSGISTTYATRPSRCAGTTWSSRCLTDALEPVTGCRGRGRLDTPECARWSQHMR